MAKRGFPVLVAIDGSAPARAALETAARFCWPAGSSGHAVVVRELARAPGWPRAVWEALASREEAEAARATARLRARWPEARTFVVPGPPADAIVRQARQLGAGAIVLGSRGLGALGRMVLGSVGRGVIRRAPCPVLVARGRPRSVRRLAVGVDGSPNAQRALELVVRLLPPRGGEVRLVTVVEPVRLPSPGLVPRSIRAALTSEAAAAERERVTAARRRLEAARAALEKAGWRVRTEVRAGRPLEELLAAGRQADAVVIGARGIGGVERLLLGSVAEGAAVRCPVPVLLVP
jgi:nucleotide-binding universal stress UspA family protein